MTKTRAAWGWRAPVFALSEALARRPSCVWELLSCTAQIVTRTVCLTGVVKETQRWLWTGGGEMKQPWGPVYHPSKKNHLLTLPSAPQGQALGASRPRTSAASRGGREWAVSSPLFIPTGDPRTGSASLFLYTVIKYRLSAQPLPEAKGKSLC